MLLLAISTKGEGRARAIGERMDDKIGGACWDAYN
jgi:hypothetical protein